jgi:hypothetical protein
MQAKVWCGALIATRPCRVPPLPLSSNGRVSSVRGEWKDGIGMPKARFPMSNNACELNGSAQHLLEVYSQESENLKSFAGVDLNAVLLCPGPIGHSGTGRFS